MGLIKEKYRQFRQWQQQPFEYHDSHDHHGCCNCGAESENNYCPRCGQKAAYGPITWHSVWQGVMDVWGVGTRSLPYTLWQLLWRPGYLIRDYISGKRQVSFPPVKMLVVVAVAFFFVGNWFFPEFWGELQETGDDVSTETGVTYYMETIGIWLSQHYEWAFLVGLSFLIIPTWFVFRFAPRYPRHTLPQGFFIQVFMTNQFLLWLFIGSLVLRLLQITDVDVPVMVISIISLVLLIDYHQLFGYGWWGTAWRIVVAVVMMSFLLYVIALPLALVDRAITGEEVNWVNVVLRTIGITGLGAVLLVAVHVINRKLWKQLVKTKRQLIILIVALIAIAIALDACFGFKALTSMLRYFKSFIGLIAIE